MILGCTIRPQPFLNKLNNQPEKKSESGSLSASFRRTWRSSRSHQPQDVPVLLEFDLDSCFNFVRTFVEKNGTLSSRKIPELVLNRIAFCDQEADSWREQIKIAHDVVSKELQSFSLFQPELPMLNPELVKKCDKIASINSRCSNNSNRSKSSRLSSILTRFLNPLKKGPRKRYTDGLELDDIKEDLEESKKNLEQNKLDSKSIIFNTFDQDEFHFYETLKKDISLTSSLPKKKLSRKQTLDFIFPELVLDQNGYISKKHLQTELDDDSAYSTIQ